MKDAADFGRSVRRGALWSYASQTFLTVLQFASGVVMARLLEPDDFGIFIAVTAFTSLFLVLVQFGLPGAILQARELSDAQVSAAFWLIVLLACLFLVVTLMVAVPLGQLYDPRRFPPVMYSMIPVFFLGSYASVGLALLRRQMRFAEVARVNAEAAVSATAVSVTTAVVGFGVYSLVLGAIVGMSVTILRAASLLRWKPGWPAIGAVRPLLPFASFATLNNVQDLSIGRADNMIVGATMGTFSLGLYNRAFSLGRMPSDQFSESLGPLVMGALSRVQTDLQWARDLFLKAVSAVSLLTMPFLALLVAAGPELIRFVYGEAWSGAGVPLQIMAVGGYFVLLGGMFQRFAYSQNLVKRTARVYFLILVTTVVLVLIGSLLGLVAVAVGIVLRDALRALLLGLLLKRSAVALTLAETVHATFPFVAASVLAMVTASVVVPLDSGAGSFQALALDLAGFGIVLFFAYIFVLVLLRLVWTGHAPLRHTFALIWDAVSTVTKPVRRVRAARPEAD